MSIATRQGDQGETTLMYDRRVAKCHPRVEACGSVDELNAQLGLARATAKGAEVRRGILAIQQDLITLMGELATDAADRSRYVQDGFPPVTPDLTATLDRLVEQFEEAGIAMNGWATPGDTLCSAALDVARTTCRRAERRVCALHQRDQLRNPEIIVYLNRLADVLWLMARKVEGEEEITDAGR